MPAVCWGCRFFFFQASVVKKSTGLVLGGIAAFVGELKAQWSLGLTSGFSFSGPGAPAAIQRSIALICAGVTGSPSGGMRSDSSSEVTRESNSLPLILPGVMIFDLPAPARIKETVSKRSLLFCFNAPWQE